MTSRGVSALASIVIAVSPIAGATGIPPGTVVLVEIAHVARGDEAVRGFHRTPGAEEGLDGAPLKADKATSAKNAMTACGIRPEDVAEHPFVLLRLYYFWHDETSRVVHDFVAWATVGTGVQVADGNIVEVELLAGPGDSRCATIRTVVSTSLKGGECAYRKNDMGALGNALGAVNPLGGPGSASVYCPFVDKEGWKKLSITAFPGASVWSTLAAPGS